MEQTEQQNKQAMDFKNLRGGLEILVQLAEKGEIDPWDVDIIEVTDKYLAALDRSPRENLLNAGRAIFYASVLLRLKSDILLNISSETLLSSQLTDNFFPEDELLSQSDGHLDLAKLEDFLVRSSLSKQVRKRKISLNDLIFALRQAEEEEERRILRAKLRAERAFTIVPPCEVSDVFEMAEEDDIEEYIAKIEAVTQEYLTTDEKPITLSFLGEILNSKLKPFLALLFLAHSQKLVLEQKEPYGEIFIHKAGKVIEDLCHVEAEKKEARRQQKSERSVVDKLKEKIRKRCKKQPITKVIEVTSDGKDVIDIKVKTNIENKEAVQDGNNPPQ